MILALMAQLGVGAPCGTLESVDQSLIDEMWMVLPEKRVLNPGYVLDISRNIDLTPTVVGGTLHMTFLIEGAGYRNQFGYFLYDPASVVGDSPAGTDIILSSEIVWENASFYYAGGDGSECLQTGHTVDVYLDPAWEGLALGFWLKANGYTCSGCPTWYSLDELNMAIDGPPEHAVVVQSMMAPDALLLGWEDLYRSSPSSDNDFNDLVLSIRSTPPELISEIAAANGLPTLNGDTDNDGLPDSIDDFPTDPLYAIDNRYPSGSELFTVAFEDMFPRIGDGDYNDFLGMGSFHEWLNADGELVQIRGRVQAVTRGAHRSASLHIRIEGAPSGEWEVDFVDRNDVLIETRTGSHNGGALDLTLFENLKTALPSYNTNVAVLDRGPTAQFRSVPDNPVAPTAIAQAPFDMYLLLPGYGYDVHTVGHTSNPGSANPPLQSGFRDANGFPWGLVFPEAWSPPTETEFIEDSYPEFAVWREAYGDTNKTWHPAADCTRHASQSRGGRAASRLRDRPNHRFGCTRCGIRDGRRRAHTALM